MIELLVDYEGSDRSALFSDCVTAILSSIWTLESKYNDSAEAENVRKANGIAKGPVQKVDELSHQEQKEVATIKPIGTMRSGVSS